MDDYQTFVGIIIGLFISIQLVCVKLSYDISNSERQKIKDTLTNNHNLGGFNPTAWRTSGMTSLKRMSLAIFIIYLLYALFVLVYCFKSNLLSIGLLIASIDFFVFYVWAFINLGNELSRKHEHVICIFLVVLFFSIIEAIFMHRLGLLFMEKLSSVINFFILVTLVLSFALPLKNFWVKKIKFRHCVCILINIETLKHKSSKDEINKSICKIVDLLNDSKNPLMTTIFLRRHIKRFVENCADAMIEKNTLEKIMGLQNVPKKFPKEIIQKIEGVSKKNSDYFNSVFEKCINYYDWNEIIEPLKDEKIGL